MTDSETNDYRVVFMSPDKKVARQDPGVIEIIPGTDRWNDFGFRVRADFVIHPRHENASRSMDRLRFSGFLGFVGKDRNGSDTRLVSSYFQSENQVQALPDKFPDFFTLLPNMGAYREVVDVLGPVEARAALLAMHDIVACEDSASMHHWLRPAKASDVFHKAFLRPAEAYFAWKNAAPLLNGLQFEDVGQLSDELHISFQLAGRPNRHELDFKFAGQDGVLPKRFAIVIGKNGVGKSQALGKIAEAALKGRADLTGPNGSRPAINRVLAFSPTSTNAAFPIDRLRRPSVWYRRFTIGDSGVGRRRQTTPDLIVQLSRSQEFIARRRRFDVFLGALGAIDRWEELALITKAPDAIPLADLVSGGEEEMLKRFGAIDLNHEPVRIIDGRSYDLSSGERSFVRFAAIASLHIENSSLLLLDEPETHLHPNFIGQFVSVLDNLLHQTGSAAIIATHSAYFVREAFEDQVIVLRSGPDRSISAEVPRLKTFGADVGTISFFVFGEDEPSRLARQVEKRISATKEPWDIVEEKYRGELSLELLGELRLLIEDRDGRAEKP